jgi:hypothetical protein
MPIISSDILFKLSTTAGSAGNSQTSTQAASLGKYISTTAWAGGTKNDLFNDVTGDENAASTVKYRCIFLHNNHASITWQNAVAWLASQVAGGADFAIGVDAAAASPIGQSTVQAAQIATELNAPTSVTFSAPTTKGAGISIGNIPPGYCRAIWIRQTATNSPAVNSDGCVIQVEGDTTA